MARNTFQRLVSLFFFVWPLVFSLMSLSAWSDYLERLQVLILMPGTWFRNPWQDAVVWTVFIIGWFLIYVFTGRAYLDLRETLLLILLASVAIFFAFPATSTDIFDYVFAGAMRTHGLNPYLVYPADAHFFYPGDPLLVYHQWKGLNVYGPLWNLFTWGIVAVAKPLGTVGIVYAIKFLAMIAHLGVSWLLVSLSRLYNVKPTYALWAYGLNPLVLYETVGAGHNDAWMLFFLLAAVLAWERRKPTYWIGTLAGLSFGIKAVAVLGILGLLYDMWLKGSNVRQLAGFLLGGFLAFLIAGLPFGVMIDPAILFNGLMEASHAMGYSWPYLLRGFGAPAYVLWGLRLLGILALLRVLTVNGEQSVPGRISATFAAYLLFVSAWNEPWYLAWVSVFLSLEPKRRVPVFGLGVGALLTYSWVYAFNSFNFMVELTGMSSALALVGVEQLLLARFLYPLYQTYY